MCFRLAVVHTDSNYFPDFNFGDWNYDKTPRFEEVSVTGLDSKILNDYDIKKVTESMNKGFPSQAKEWNISQERLNNVDFSLVKKDKNAVTIKKHYNIIKNIASMALRKSSAGYSPIEVIECSIDNAEITRTILEFDNVSAFSDDEDLNNFVSLFLKGMKQEYPNVIWRVSNKLISDNQLIFKAK